MPAADRSRAARVKVTFNGRTITLTTLGQAFDAAAALRPERHSDASTWLTYYRRLVAMYEEVAEVDRGHHYSALWHAHDERDRVACWERVYQQRGPKAVVAHIGGWPEGSPGFARASSNSNPDVLDMLNIRPRPKESAGGTKGTRR